VVTGGNTATNSIAIYRVDPGTRKLVDVAARTIKPGLPVHGSCMYRSTRSGRFYVFVDSEDGKVEQWELFDAGGGKIDARRVRQFRLGRRVEACVADDERARFYISAEREGIRHYGAEPDAGVKGRPVVSVEPGQLVPDVEGLAIVPRGAGGYLLASSQGDSTFAAYRLRGYDYVGSFAIRSGGGIDGVSETDGIEVTTASLSPAFPGLFVTQDDANDKENQNFKLVPWQPIRAALRG
jgi:3-phytase